MTPPTKHICKQKNHVNFYAEENLQVKKVVKMFISNIN